MEISAILMGQRVRSARKAKEMSTEELAEKVGVAVESIGHIECGARKPSLNLLYNIAEVLGVSLDYLTGRTENSSDALLHECADSNDLTGEQEQMLLEKYYGSFDLEEVRVAAESMGMIPAEDAIHVRVELPGETVQIEHLSWWDSVMLSLRRFFA